MSTMELKTDPRLLRALDAAKNIRQTEEDLRKQRVSFIFGFFDADSSVTRDRIKHVLDAQEGRLPA